MRLDFGLPQSSVYDFYLWYCVEGSGGYHEVTDDFDEVADLNPDVPEESIARPSTNDHDNLWVYSG